MTIPRVLHQTWRDADLPEPLARWRSDWLRLHPRWTHRLWTDDATAGFVAQCFPALWPAFQALPRDIQRVDLFRYLVVFEHGGLYADLDMRCFRPVDRQLEGARVVLSEEAHLGRTRQRELGYARPLQLANCIFAAEPGHPLLGAVIDAAVASAERPVLEDADVEDTTGPRLLTRVVEALGPEALDGVRVLPQVTWMAPREYTRFWPWVHARHEAVGSWRTTSTRRSLWRRWVERSRLPSPVG